MDLGIDVNVWPWIWLVIAVVFALVELTLIAGSFIVLPFAVSALAASLLAFTDASVALQWLVFVVGGAVLFALLFRVANRFVADRDLPPGVGAERLVGMLATVREAIPESHSPDTGVVAVEGEVWRAVSEDSGFSAGVVVEITGVRGTRVVVRAVEAPR